MLLVPDSHTEDFFRPSRRLPEIVVVQPTEDGTLADSTILIHQAGNLLLDSLMWPLTVVECDVLFGNSLDLTSANQRKLSSTSLLNDRKKRSIILFMFGASTPVVADTRLHAR